MVHTYKHLIVSPFSMRETFFKLISKEIKKVKDGKEGLIIVKLNNLVDEDLIDKLKAAADKGVKVKLIVRSVCAMQPHPNIEMISIVDRFLEHARIFVFGPGEPEHVYISSADWMIRNLDYRVEVACTILDTELKKEIINYLNIQLSDSVKARILNENQDNPYKKMQEPGEPVRSQSSLIRFYEDKIKKPGVTK